MDCHKRIMMPTMPDVRPYWLAYHHDEEIYIGESGYCPNCGTWLSPEGKQIKMIPKRVAEILTSWIVSHIITGHGYIPNNYEEMEEEYLDQAVESYADEMMKGKVTGQ